MPPFFGFTRVGRPAGIAIRGSCFLRHALASTGAPIFDFIFRGRLAGKFFKSSVEGRF